ncbi:MAG: S8 family serine peptidase [Chloroflexi bacterium]|nr:S8 family serine peptidase [Chloroflexota bacterium]
MKSRPLSILVAFILLVSVAVPLAIARGGLAQPTPAGDAFAPGRLLIRFQAFATPETAQATLAQEGLTIQRRLEGPDVYVADVPAGEELTAAARLRRLPAVKYAEPDYIYRAFRVPNDPYYASDQWNLPQINAPAAWNITTGSISVTVAILDTGVDLGHPDLSSKIVAGYDFVNEDNTPQDDEGHGTHVAGIAAALSDNATGVAGVAWGARIMPIKVLDGQGSGFESDIAEGIHWAADHGAAVINMSLGGTAISAALQDAVNYAYGHGLLIVAAAGNEYLVGNPTVYPAAYPHVVAVAATNDQDGHASYSSTGAYVDIAAPGGDPSSSSDPNPRHWIMSTYLRTAATGVDSVQAAYERHAGTSMATPHVVGLAALVWSQHPGWTNDQVEWAIESTARDVGDSGPDEVFGWGRIDAAAAVTLADLPATSTPTPSTCLAESPHPYPNSANTTYTVTNPDPIALYSRVRFTRVELETGLDYVIIRDEAGNEIQRVTGNRGGFWSAVVPGRLVRIQLTSDGSVTGWGFCVNQVETAAAPAWAIRAPLSLPRSRLALAATGGKLYAIGGESASAAAGKLLDSKPAAAAMPPAAGVAARSADSLAGVQGYSGLVEEYDPATNTWTTKASMPTPLSNVTAAVIGGKIYVPGGWNDAISNLLQIYDPAADRWTAGASLPVGLLGAAAVALDGQLYVLGGGTASSTVNTCYRYDPASNQWAQCAAMHTARVWPGAGTVAGKLYVGGGSDLSANDLNTLEEYDPATDRWTIRAAMSAARGGPGAVGAGDTLYVVGGGWNSYLNTGERYDPFTDRWETIEPISVGRRTLGLTELDGKLYAVGGWNGGFTGVNEAYTLPLIAQPAIRLAPAAFGVTVVVGEATTRTLAIGNAGQMTLTFDIRDAELTTAPAVTIRLASQPSGALPGGVKTGKAPLPPQPWVESGPPLQSGGESGPPLQSGGKSSPPLQSGGESSPPLQSGGESGPPLQSGGKSGGPPLQSGGESGGPPLQSGGEVDSPRSRGAGGAVFEQELRVSHGLVATTTVRLLVVSSDHDINDLLAVLNAFPDVQATRYAGSGAPALADLAPYDVVLTSNNRMWAAAGINPDALGDALAAYVDRGGHVVTASYAYDFSDWGIGGRFARAGYGPLDRATADLNRLVQLGTTLAGHPILQGVTALSEAAIHQNAALATGAALVASWDDGTPLVATRTAVVALNLLPSLGDGTHRWTGDAPTLIHNAIVWLAGATAGPDAAWLAVAPAAGLVAPGGQSRVAVNFNTSDLPVGAYTATLIVSSNDPAKSLQQVPVALQVVPPPPEIEVSPVYLAAKVAPGGATERRLTIHNTGRGELNYAITETLRVTQTTRTPTPARTPVVVTVGPVPTAAPPATPTRSSTPTAAPAPTATPLAAAGGAGGGSKAAASKPTEPAVSPAGVAGPASGGPDPFGYTYATSAEAGGPAYNWIEIAPPAGGSGIEITTLTGRDDAYLWPLPLPFAFNFYGAGQTQMAVNSNGTLYFNDYYLGYGNGPIPGSYGANRFLAHFWDDLVIVPGAVYYLAEPGRLIVEYYHASGCCLTPDSATWEVILYDTGNILYQYQDVSFGSGRDQGGEATVGIQGDAATGLQYSYNAAALSDGLAICFAYPGQPANCATQQGVPWLTEQPISGVVPPGGAAVVNVTLDAAGLDLGTYGANLVITSNDPDEGTLLVPVTLTVTTTPGEATLSLSPAAVRVEPAQPFTLTLRLGAGQQPVDAVDAVLGFDPARLRVVDANGVEAAAITPGDAFPLILQNRVSNADGQIIFSAGRQPGQAAPSGDLALGMIRFVAVTETLASGTPVRFLPASDVFYGGGSILLATADSVVTAFEPFVIGRVALQGRGAAPSARWQDYPLRLAFYPPGDATPVAAYETVLDANGVFTATHVVVGVYDVIVKNSHSLSNRRTEVTTPGDLHPLDFGTLLEGDATDDDQVAGGDFSVVVTAYGASPGQPNWDARADFNGDAFVGGADFSLLMTNYGRQGPIAVGNASASRGDPSRSPWAGARSAPTDDMRSAPTDDAPGVILRISPPAGAVMRGATFAVDVFAQAGSQGVDVVDTAVSFDPAHFQVVDAAGNLTTGIVPGDGLPIVLQNQADNGTGRIRFSAGRQPGGAMPAGDLRVATIRFRAIATTHAGGAAIGFGEGTGVFSRGQPVPVTRTDGRVIVAAGGVSGYLPLIGR